jgi:hypothetical protein
MKRAVLWVCMVLAGCQASYGYQWRTTAGIPAGGNARSSAAGISVAVPADSVVGAMLIGVVVADGVRYYLRMPDGTRVPYHGVPDPDPGRRINVQDCTRPIDVTAGNLMCR